MPIKTLGLVKEVTNNISCYVKSETNFTRILVPT